MRLKIGGGQIDVNLISGGVESGREVIRKWVADAAQAVAVYFGRFPVARTIVDVTWSAGRSGVFGAVTHGGPPAQINIKVGPETSAEEFEADWTMTHELTHLGFPCVPRQHHWIEEGMATYVEPVARVQAGTLNVEQIWSDMVRDMPKGEPGQDGRGLDRTHTWASTYWGGALFCLLADVQYRERTRNQRGLQHALRAILKAGGNIQVDWPIARALQVGDEAAGVPVLAELYAGMKDAPVTVDLPELWRRLGVSVDGRHVTFQPDAELSAVREAITAKPR
jgi:hypothetical protein